MNTPAKPIQRFSLKQLLLVTALVGTMLAFYVACPVYGVAFVAASLVLLVGWLLMRLSDQIDSRQIDERRPAAKRFGIAGAMLIWVGVMMMIFCFPACLVEMTRKGDRFKDYDLYLEEQGRLPPQK
jgi:L-asparagine transporter-like permease